MSADLWTPEDVERVARRIAATRTDCDPAYPCHACHESAVAALAALADAGRLLPADGQWQWTVRDKETGRLSPLGLTDEQMARATAAEVFKTMQRDMESVRRWVGPWQPVQDTEEKP